MTNDHKPAREPIKVTFSLPQIIGGALAAATAAAIGSTLGVAGTILGASVASIIGGIAGTLYSAGLDSTHRRVSQAVQRGYHQVVDPDEVETRILPTAEVDDTLVEPGAAVTDASADGAEPADHTRRNRILVTMGLSAAAIFVVALLAITLVELGLGRSLDGSGTTTVGGPRPTATVTVAGTQPATSRPSTTATPTLPSATPTPSATASTVPPTPSASASASATPLASEPVSQVSASG